MSSLVKKQYDNFIWGLKYRPSKVSEIVIPDRFKTQFQNIVDTKNIPNMLLSGPRGCGKTTTAFCIADEIGCDTKYINMSKDNSIDVIREDISNFANTMAFTEGKKLIIGDEFDRLSIQAIDALKGDIEQFGKNCVFIFTSNHKYKFADHPVMSRLQEIDFEFTKQETIQMQKQFYKKLQLILKKEEVKFDNKSIGHVIKNIFPDMRKILNELQKISQQNNNVIDSSIAQTLNISADIIMMLFAAIKDKDFRFVREFIAELTIEPSQLYSILFKNIRKYVEVETFPSAINILDEEQYRSAFSVDKEIPLTNCCLRLMNECTWK